MIVMLLGSNLEYLSGWVHNIEHVDSVILSRSQFEAIPLKYGFLQQEVALIICDVNRFKANDVYNSISDLQKTFYNAEFWALFDKNSSSLKSELHQIGFTEIVHYKENINDKYKKMDISKYVFRKFKVKLH